MIKLIDNNINTFKGVIIVPSNKEIYYKNKYVDYDLNITTLKKYITSLYEGSYKISSSFIDYIYMYKAFLLVKDSLKRYNNYFSFYFVNELINTYSKFYDYKLKDNDKVHDLKLIYNKYEELLIENGFINYKLIMDYVIESYKGEEDILLLDLESLDDNEINFIKKISLTNDIYINPVLLENNNLISELEKLNVTANVDILNNENSIIFNENNDIEEELSFVLNDISKKVLEGHKYKDFLIVSNDISYYEPYFEYVFDIPYRKKEISGMLTSNFLNYFSKMLNGDFSCRNFINLLKLDVFELSKEIVDKLDNYVYSWDLEDKSFYDPFTFNPNGNKSTFSKKDEELLEKLNNAKESIITPIKYLLENIVGVKDVKIILKEFYTYLSEEKIDEKLSKADYKGLNNFIELLENINDYLDINMDVSSLFELINSISLINTKNLNMQDEVSISSLEDALYEDKKFIYLIGASSSVFPKPFKLSSLIGQNDVTKEELIDKINEYENKEHYYLCKLLNNPNVTISCHKLSKDLKLLEKAKFIDCLNIINASEDEIYNKKLLMDKYALLLSEGKIDSINKDIFNKINKSNSHDLNYKISNDAVNKLLSNDLKVSPSSIENYAKCPFYYFCSNALRLKVKEKYLFDNREVGTFVHYVLENIIKNDYDKITLSNISEYVNKYSINYLEDNNKIVNNTSLYVIRKLSDNVSMILKNIIKENNISLFKPTYFEFKISDTEIIKPVTINLDKGSLSIIGTMDRVDTYEDDNKFYYRIIDYKTGTKKFRLDDMLGGLNLQMLLYMLAIKENKDRLTNKEVIPAGIFYYPSLVKEKTESKGINDIEKEESIKERLKMDGILNYSDNTLEVYGKEAFGEFANVTSRGKFNEERLYDSDDLENIFGKLKDILKQIGDLILDGNFEVNPILSTRVDSCTYCKYKSVCKFDYQIDKKRKLRDYSNKEVLQMLEGDKNA